MSQPLSTKALSLLSHIREGKVETAKASVMSKLMLGHKSRRELEEATGLTSGSVTGRLNELVKAGLVTTIPEKFKDPITKKMVNHYRRTGEVMQWQN